ncbi:MAG: acetyltransferase [bacterium]|nr:acetyltransferase [bacterium]
MSSEHCAMKDKLIILGAGGHAKVVADAVRLAGNFEIVGFLDDLDEARWGSPFCESTVLGGSRAIPELRRQGLRRAVIAVGDCAARHRLTELVCAEGFEPTTVIHPSAVVSPDIEIGPGTVLLAGSVVNCGSRLGRSVIINTAASVDHDCAVDDAVHICPGVHLAAHVHVGSEAWVGIGSCVRDRVHIGAGSCIGAGSVVVSDIPAGALAYGAPCRKIRKVGPTEDGSGK